MVNIEYAPWFSATDVCTSLGLSVAGSGVGNYLLNLGAYEKKVVTNKGIPNLFRGTSGGWRTTLISESGLYKLTMRSDQPEAKGFQDWVTKVVLPAIRKDGGYVAGYRSVSSRSKMVSLHSSINENK